MFCAYSEQAQQHLSDFALKVRELLRVCVCVCACVCTSVHVLLRAFHAQECVCLECAKVLVSQVFRVADDEDRSGRPITKKTAQNFLAAYTFFEALEQFGTVPPEVPRPSRVSPPGVEKGTRFTESPRLQATEKLKYSRWKAGAQHTQKSSLNEMHAAQTSIPPASDS